MSEKRNEIIEVATRMIREGGYNAFSFREIADYVGVKSSSVHYYFRHKENLAVAAAECYTEQFFEQLGSPSSAESTAKEKFQHYSSVFINAFQTSGRACLCGILSHEAPSLPEAVTKEVGNFVDQNLDWLGRAYSSGPAESRPEDPEAFAFLTYSALEGAMAASTLKKDIKWLKLAKQEIEKAL